MKKILVIDDQPDILEMVAYILRTEGYETAVERSGEAGLQRAHAIQPDLVLCDIMMPGTDGHEVLRRMREDPALATVPFVFLTARAGTDDLRAGMNLGADDYLTKPFSADELLGAVHAQLTKDEVRQDRFDRRMRQLREGLSAVLPHELRTPLTLILAHSSMLLEMYDSYEPDEVLASLAAIHSSGERLHRLVENLLMYVELQEDATLRLEHPRTEQPADVIRQAAEQEARAADRLDDLQVDVEAGPLQVHAFHLQKVVEELLSNAFKFSEAGTPVRLTAASAGNGLELRVCDEGRGMSAEQVEQLGAYVQLGRRLYEQQGGGLGLALVRRLAHVYDGRVEIDSTPGQGTLVHVHLRQPRVPDGE